MHIVQLIERLSALHNIIRAQKAAILGILLANDVLPLEYQAPVLASLKQIKSMGENMIKETPSFSEAQDQ